MTRKCFRDRNDIRGGGHSLSPRTRKKEPVLRRLVPNCVTSHWASVTLRNRPTRGARDARGSILIAIHNRGIASEFSAARYFRWHASG